MLVYNNDNNTNDNDNDNDDIYRRPPLQALGRRKGPTKTIESNDELHIVYIYIYISTHIGHFPTWRQLFET